MGNKPEYVVLSDEVSFRGLETPCLYHIGRDELYELEDDGLRFLEQAERSMLASEISDRDILDFALEEGVASLAGAPSPKKLARGQAPLPSLRYLELMPTLRCNLRCAHCYLGEPETLDMDIDTLEAVIEQFDRMQGLRLLISGGEPLMYPRLAELGELIRGRGFRSVLLTNGVMLGGGRLDLLPVREVQVSIDGLREGHDSLRGEGNFDKAVRAARLVVERGLDLSVATMIHSANIKEMEGLEDLVKDLGAREWGLDLPAEAGRWARSWDKAALLDDAGKAMARGFGGSYHGSAEGYACGLHLASVMPDGRVCPCGFYADTPLGLVGDGLDKAWTRKEPLPIGRVEGCAQCGVADDCHGGCRYRAGGEGPDPVMCAANDWPIGRPDGDE